jgi:hypothetical protein
MKQEQQNKRRSFLKALLAGSAITAVATAGETAEDARAAGMPGRPGPAGKNTEILYQETEEFRRYYASLRS